MSRGRGGFRLAYFAALNFRELWHSRELSSEHPSIGASEHVRNCRFCASLTCRYRLRDGAYICSKEMAAFLSKSAAEFVWHFAAAECPTETENGSVDHRCTDGRMLRCSDESSQKRHGHTQVDRACHVELWLPEPSALSEAQMTTRSTAAGGGVYARRSSFASTSWRVFVSKASPIAQTGRPSARYGAA